MGESGTNNARPEIRSPASRYARTSPAILIALARFAPKLDFTVLMQRLSRRNSPVRKAAYSDSCGCVKPRSVREESPSIESSADQPGNMHWPEVASREHLATRLVSGVVNALRFSAHLFGALFAKSHLNGRSGSPFIESAHDPHELASHQNDRAPQYEGNAIE